MKLKKYTCAFVLIAIVAVANFYCGNASDKKIAKNDSLQFLNHHDSVKYVGINTCKQCHSSIYETFIRTGMGKSFDIASREKSSAMFGKDAVIYDKHRNFYYKSFWQNNSMYIQEFRMKGSDTIFKRTEKVDYIVGSGQHTNSHLCIRNGYVTQLPMTFYTQKKQWDLPPGFEDGANTRFSRSIGLECMSCHNSYPDFVQGSENKFNGLPNGIGCERCHGPGAAHVAKIKNADITDTSKYIDYSIVNPAKLPVDLQFDVCQRCHLQGNAVLKNNHSFYDFKPGMKLSDYISVFLPKYKNADDEFVMASHAYRLKQSKCFIKTFDAAKASKELRPYKNGLTCVTCHNPHISVREKNKNSFNDACKKCHGNNDDKNCTLTISKRNLQNNNCVGCHMPQSGAIDIPHVSVHDHWIRKPIAKSDKNAIKQFIGLVAINEKKPAASTKALAYLNYYEKFSKQQQYLDSAFKYIDVSNTTAIINQIELISKYYFFRNDYKALLQIANNIGTQKLLDKILTHKSFENKDAWVAYRIGEAFSQFDNLQQAELFFKKAVKLAPYFSDFKNKLGATIQKQNRNTEAQQLFQDIVNENAEYVPALSNLGYMYMLAGNLQMATFYIEKALAYDPDYVLALLNNANLQLQKGNKIKAIETLKKILDLQPENAQAKDGIARLRNM